MPKCAPWLLVARASARAWPAAHENPAVACLPSAAPATGETAPRFAADAMLARLARWLRLLGWDTTLDAALHDGKLVRQAEQEDRVLLTRDRHLLRELRPHRALRIEHDDPLQQLAQVVRQLALAPPAELFTRCTVCNTALSAPLPPQARAALLPADVRELPGPARHCPGCGRLYWRGSHARRMRAALERALPGWLRREP
ncbi:Mut7-C RNAse domain-containing protein [Ramlibacter tataouinensis]|uniref:Mut7-C RNAse domain-containing protein n=1 Tax=Ramlibacter tataouinensis TaxID=94132 RepID=UPI0022F3E50B|nr:Mut7-C RNAse domain-containing protein [Ramlibacter tataouinensis]WBY00452.1 Mut7-C RNAse domain-containing protein [Ramlibacter tataouinensis]